MNQSKWIQNNNLTGVNEINLNRNSQIKIVLKRDDKQESKNMILGEDIEMREDGKMEKMKKLINKNNA